MIHVNDTFLLKIANFTKKATSLQACLLVQSDINSVPTCKSSHLSSVWEKLRHFYGDF